MKRQTVIAVASAVLCSILLSCSVEEPPVRGESFTIVVVPDTQNAVDATQQKAAGYAIDSSDIFFEQMRYVANRAVPKGGDVVFVASVGDVWQHVSSGSDLTHEARGVRALANVESPIQRFVNHERVVGFEIPTAIRGYELISDANIPFGVAPGNHDYDAWWVVAAPAGAPKSQQRQSHVGGLDNFRIAFGNDTSFFQDKEWYVDSVNGGGSSAQVFNAGGYRFLHFAFEMHAGDDVIDWARGVIANHPGLPTIITTHDFLSPRGERFAGSMDLGLVDPEGNNSANEIWEKFISPNDQIFMVLSGHQPGQARRVDENNSGHEVHQILANFQLRGRAGVDAGEPLRQGIGDGWHREMTFHLGGADPRIDVRTYSTHYDAYANELESYAEWYKMREQPELTDEQFVAADEFVITLKDWRARFGAPGSN